MKKIPLTQGQFALVDDEDFDWLMQWKWHAHQDSTTRKSSTCKFRVERTQRVHGKVKTIVLARQIMEFPLGKQIDHVNLDPLDNRRSNLRICLPAENARNQNLRINNSSGFKGVSWWQNKWVSSIRLNRKSHYLGRFDSAREAAAAYNGAARVLHGEFAKLNFLET
jgi:hypothetical protein